MNEKTAKRLGAELAIALTKFALETRLPAPVFYEAIAYLHAVAEAAGGRDRAYAAHAADKGAEPALTPTDFI
jgi:hypothetical protein